MKLIPSTKPYFSKKQLNFINKAQKDIFKSGKLILGPYTKMFEENFADYIGTKYAIATNSCSSALEICLRFFDIKDKEVILPTNTFVASANAAIFAGAKPVLADIEKESLCLNVNSFLDKINKKTNAVIVVHIAGLAHPQIDEIRKICKKRHLLLIEDVAHAIGAEINGKKAGTIGEAGCFSFYPTKIMTTGVGGMITTNNSELAKYARIVRHHGAGKGLEDIQELGSDWLMDEARASLGIAQLEEIEQMITKRILIAKKYCQKIKSFDLEILQNFKNTRHVYYKFPILFKSKKLRDKVKNTLMDKFNIETGSVYYPPIHRMSLYRRMYKFEELDFPIANNVLPRVLCLPIFVRMTDKEVAFVVESLRNALSSSHDRMYSPA